MIWQVWHGPENGLLVVHMLCGAPSFGYFP